MHQNLKVLLLMFIGCAFGGLLSAIALIKLFNHLEGWLSFPVWAKMAAFCTIPPIIGAIIMHQALRRHTAGASDDIDN